MTRRAEQSDAQLALLPASVINRRRHLQWRKYRVEEGGSLVARYVLEDKAVSLPTEASDDETRDRKWTWTAPRLHRGFDELPYEDDFRVRMFVRDHPDGASLEEIAKALGMTKEGISGIEKRAIRRVMELARTDPDAAEWAASVGLTRPDLPIDDAWE